MTEPPYQRIVADIRARIADGRLEPGARLPSIRQIAKEWGVALATATKAVTVLRQQGAVIARPRVGTVVAGPASRDEPPPPASRTRRVSEVELTREQVVRAAIEIADTEGLDALSMRGVAARLGVATMSTYRHVTSKDQLVILMADAAFGELGYAPPHPKGWRPLLERAAATMWALHRRHPWLAHVTPLSRPLPLPNLIAHGEEILRAFDGFGFDAVALLDLQVMLYSHIQGLAGQLELETQAQATTGLTEDEWIEAHGRALDDIATSGHYPRFATMLNDFTGTGYDLDLDKIFALGLRTILDGLAVLLTDRRASA